MDRKNKWGEQKPFLPDPIGRPLELMRAITVSKSAAICAANSNRLQRIRLEGLEIFSNWKNIGVVRQSASATMMVTLAGYCVHSTLVPAIVPKFFLAPTEEIDGKELLFSNGGGCYK